LKLELTNNWCVTDKSDIDIIKTLCTDPKFVLGSVMLDVKCD